MSGALLEGKLEEILGEAGVLQNLTKRLVERALQAFRQSCQAVPPNTYDLTPNTCFSDRLTALVSVAGLRRPHWSS